MKLRMESFCLFIVLSCVVCAQSSQEAKVLLPLKGKSVEQSSTQNGHNAELATDGDPKTWSQTFSDSLDSIGWWKVDLGGNYRVAGFTLTSSEDPYDAYHLQEFEIKILTESGKQLDCAKYTDKPFGPRVTKYIPCASPVEGRFCLVRKLPGSYRKDAMTLAEVEVHVMEMSSTTSATIALTTKAATTAREETTLVTAATTLTITTPGPARIDVGPPNSRLELPKQATQIGSYGYHVADFAIDGDERTCNIACHPCDQTTKYGHGWWQYDFETVRTVTEVQLLTCIHQYSANYLRDIVIGLSTQNTTSWDELTVCNEQSKSQEDLPVSKWLTFRCRAPVSGRYLTIIRKKDALYRPDAISLAEIRVKDSHGNVIDTTGAKRGSLVDGKTLQEKLKSGEWLKIDLSRLETSQIGTFDNHESRFAIDGDPSTYSVACKVCHLREGIGWWMINFGKSQKIAALTIASSSSDYDSNYLQEFIIEVGKEGVAERCTEYVNRTYIPPLTQITLLCDHPLEGTELTISRRKNSSFRTDALAIGELSVYALGGRRA